MDRSSEADIRAAKLIGQIGGSMYWAPFFSVHLCWYSSTNLQTARCNTYYKDTANARSAQQQKTHFLDTNNETLFNVSQVITKYCGEHDKKHLCVSCPCILLANFNIEAVSPKIQTGNFKRSGNKIRRRSQSSLKHLLKKTPGSGIKSRFKIQPFWHAWTDDWHCFCQ